MTGNQLTEWRVNDMKMTPQEAADALKVSLSTYQNWEAEADGVINVQYPHRLRLRCGVIRAGFDVP